VLAVIKWSIYARFTGRSQLFSIQFIMWWLYGLLVQALGASSMTWIEGTEFMSLLLRVLGATVGNNVYFDTTPPIETDQLTIGNNVSILTSHQALVPHTLDRGMLQFSPITLGDDVTLGFNSCVMALATVEDGACVGPNSLISKGETVPRGAYAYGVPCSVLSQPLSTSYTEDGYEASPVFCEPQVCLQVHCDFDAELECSEPDASSTMPRLWAPAYSEKDVDSESERRPLLGRLELFDVEGGAPRYLSPSQGEHYKRTSSSLANLASGEVMKPTSSPLRRRAAVDDDGSNNDDDSPASCSTDDDDDRRFHRSGGDRGAPFTPEKVKKK